MRHGEGIIAEALPAVAPSAEPFVYSTGVNEEREAVVPDIMDLIEKGDGEAVARLVALHPDAARARDSDGVSALLHAVYRGRREIAELLDAAGAERDLFNAAALGKCDRIREQLEDDPRCHEAFSSDGWTALHLAAFFGHAEAVKLMVEKGADPRAVSRNGQANHPLHAACASGKSEAALVLIGAGADPAWTAAGYTPLHIAAANGLLDVVRALLHAGADPRAVDPSGRTPLDHARERGRAAVETLIVQAQG
jgi:ankyrin repeat protein